MRTCRHTGRLLSRCAPQNTVFDIATPPATFEELLESAEEEAAVLLQKPMGENLQQARAIREVCRRKRLTAAVNFQLRFAPGILAARGLIEQGLLGEIHDMEARSPVFTPWRLWSFLERLPRMEIPMHSIHYLDLVRSFLGDPRAIWARTIRHPSAPKLASSRSSMILDYGDMLWAKVSTNHGHAFGQKHQESYIKWEGTHGAVKTRLGLLMDYPTGAPDEFEYCALEEGRPREWRSLPLKGTWFPDAFIGSMGSLMRFLEGSSNELPTAVEDAYRTMELVEAAYRSNDSGGTTVAAG